MQEKYFSIVILFFAVAVTINSLHETLYGWMHKLALSDSKSKRGFVLVKWVSGSLFFAAFPFLLFWVAAFYIVRDPRESIRVALTISAISLALAVLMSKQVYEHIRPVYKLIETQDERVGFGEHFEAQVFPAVAGVLKPSGILWSATATSVQLGILLAVASSPDHSRLYTVMDSPATVRSTIVIFVYFAVPLILFYIWQYWFNPGRKIANLCIRYYMEENSNVGAWHIGVSRWRTLDHKRGFRIADALVRSLSGLQGKVSEEDYKRIDHAFRCVANGLRIRSIRAEVGELDVEYAKLCTVAIGLAVDVNILRSCERAERVAAEFPPEERRASRVLKYLSHIDTFVDRYARSLLALMGVMLAAYLVVTGKIGMLIELLIQTVQS